MTMPPDAGALSSHCRQPMSVALIERRARDGADARTMPAHAMSARHAADGASAPRRAMMLMIVVERDAAADMPAHDAMICR